MKCLYISKGDLPDYQSDMVFHGGRTVFGENFVDANHMWYMYRTDRNMYWNERVPNNGNSYGRGMTIHGKLDSIAIDRTDIQHKIKSRYYDYVMYGSIERCDDYIQLVVENYPRNRVVFIDGEDNTNINLSLQRYGVMFKRELATQETPGLCPINFSIPKELIVDRCPQKTQDWGTVIPGNPDTYVFYDETQYHEDYQKSYFALTHKKGGWDCLRHYEILMNGCLPYFPDLEKCPSNTMSTFPKTSVLEINRMISGGAVDMGWYVEKVNSLLQYTRKHLTTDSLIHKILDRLNS